MKFEPMNPQPPVTRILDVIVPSPPSTSVRAHPNLCGSRLGLRRPSLGQEAE